MPKASRETASDRIDGHGFDGAYEAFAAGYTVGFETFTDDVDMTPRLKDLPDGLCPSPHWGYVLRGKLVYAFDDHEELLEAGDAFYVPAGHTLRAYAGSEVVFFSPTTEWQQTVARIGNREAARA